VIREEYMVIPIENQNENRDRNAHDPHAPKLATSGVVRISGGVTNNPDLETLN
jgi:hypothetical protein